MSKFSAISWREQVTLDEIMMMSSHRNATCSHYDMAENIAHLA
jgi:hypothetical protein